MLKKLAAITFAALLLSLCACAGDRTEAPTTSTTAILSTTRNTMQSTTFTTTVSTSQTTTTETTQTTTVTTVASTEPHTHSYKSSVTKKATCTAEGTRKYTCSCGDSYTETIKAKGHDWGKWLQIVTGNTLEPTGTYRICNTCKAEERSVNYSAMLKKYVTLVGWLNRSYSSPSQITAEEAAKALPMILSTLPEFTDDPNIATRTYPISDLNACAKKCFGRTFDFTGVKNLSMFGYGTISYDSAKSALVWSFPYGQDLNWHTTVFEKYATADNNTKFSVKYHYEYTDGTKSDTYSFIVELKNSNYVITSVSQ